MRTYFYSGFHHAEEGRTIYIDGTTLVEGKISLEDLRKQLASEMSAECGFHVPPSKVVLTCLSLL